MIVEKSMHDTWLSNAWVVGSRPGGTAVIVDTGAPIEPLLAFVDQHALRVTHVLNTHEHHDHTLHNKDLVERFDVPLLLADDVADGELVEAGELRLQPLSTPGHVPIHVAWGIAASATPWTGPELVCTGDALFHGTVGGTMGGGEDGFTDLRHSVLEVLLALPPTTRLLPGHVGETTVAHELASNPFVRMWRGVDEQGSATVRVADQSCTLVLEAADYDGGTKAWVRFPDGRNAIVGGSMLDRAPASGQGASNG